jgi:ribosomal protein S18 acetylase RimI-like enzyme
MLFRQASVEDLDAVMSAIEDGRAALAAMGLDQWQGGSPNAEMVREDMACEYTYVAVDDETGDVLGTVSFMDAGDGDYDNVIDGAWTRDLPNTPNPPHGGRYAALHRIAVSAKAARRGVGTFLVKQSIRLARERGLDAVRADTHIDNIPMQRTFEKCGMVRCCEILLSTDDEPTKERIGYELALS